MLTETHAVTVLAFVFIPMNLASSIFGMNVQQINKTGHSIELFIYTSVALLLMSAIAFYFRRSIMLVLRRLRKLAVRTWDHLRKLAIWMISTDRKTRTSNATMVVVYTFLAPVWVLFAATFYVGNAIFFAIIWIRTFLKTHNMKAANQRVEAIRTRQRQRKAQSI
jgi:hypothetical protein